MANIALSSNGMMDGDRAVDRNNDLVQMLAYTTTDGSRVPVVTAAGSPYHALSAGIFPGVTIERKFGANSAVGTTEEDIWFNGGLYPWPTTAQTVRVRAGGNPNDDAGGTGAQTIRVVGLDETWAEVTEDITLAGAGASAATTTTFIRLYRAYVLTCGTYTGANTGNIIIENTGSTDILANIEAGMGQTQLTMWTVPLGYRAYIDRFFLNVSGNKPTSLFFWQRQNSDDVTTPFTSKRLIRPVYELQGAVEYNVAAVGPYPAKTDFWWSGYVPTTSSSVDVGYDVVLEAIS